MKPSAQPNGPNIRSGWSFELNIILKMGFPGYFLIVADFHQLGQEQRLPGGAGARLGRRVAGGLCAQDHRPGSARTTTLLFERFLNPERVSMPDFDIDFCQSQPRPRD